MTMPSRGVMPMDVSTHLPLSLIHIFTLVPALSHINPASIAQAEECIRIGREEAERRMPEILEAMRQKRELLHEELPPAKEG